MAATYKVSAPLVVALVGGKVQHLYLGDIVPANIDRESLENLKSLAFVSTDQAVDPIPDAPGEAGEAVQRPAESGPGSAKEKWLDYAKAKGVEVDGDASKDDIIAAVKAAEKQD